MTFQPRQPLAPAPADLTADYLELGVTIDRLRQAWHDTISDELERLAIQDLNSVQASLIHSIGDAKIPAGDLRRRRLYVGTNPSYNLRQLAAAGYLSCDAHETDRRIKIISLTDKGQAVRSAMRHLFTRQAERMAAAGTFDGPTLAEFNSTARTIESVWQASIRFIY